jgi:hypothetical protein
MRNLVIIAAAVTALAGCFTDDDLVTLGDVEQDISKAQCDELGNPYPGCPAFTPTTDACKGPEPGKPWNINGDWVNGQPICLGFADKIGTCDKCNYLEVPKADYNLCLNHRFVECAKAGKLPGQTSGDETCFVTAPQSVTCDDYPKTPGGKIKWPPKGQATAREMCFMKPPSTQAVKECREKAKCAEKGKKVGCACEPCEAIASTGTGTATGTGESCSEDCEYEVSLDPTCNPPEVCET